MNVYAAYKFNQLDDNDYTKAAGVATDDQGGRGYRLPVLICSTPLRDMPSKQDFGPAFLYS